MTNSQLLKLLVDRKVADSYQFLDSCQYKLDMAELSYKALENLITKYQKEEATSINNVFSEAHQNGHGSYTAHCSVVDFLELKLKQLLQLKSYLRRSLDFYIISSILLRSGSTLVSLERKLCRSKGYH